MCGIAGVYAYHYAAPDVCPDEVRRMRDHQSKRGPDGKGEWVSEDRRVALGHTRLSILDLSEAGEQPMVSDDGDLVISYNGEIYNFREIRTRLRAQGFSFRSDCDTEVLLNLYKAEGTKMFRQLLGMYAICLYDRKQKKLLLARDPFGIKPLYYADDGWAVRVASQVRALLESGSVSRSVDRTARLAFHIMGSVPEPLTWFSSVKSVPAGCYLWVDELGVSEPQEHTSHKQLFGVEQEPTTGAHVREILSQSVARHLESDVPVGLFLSAGMDSSVLLSLMSERAPRVNAITLAFEEFRGTPGDESLIAARNAERFGAEHVVRYVSEGEFLDDFPDIVTAMDQPTVDGINSWFVAKAAREQNLKVCMSGVGSDEMFCGYPAFVDIPQALQYARPVSFIPGAAVIWRTLIKLLIASGFHVNPKFTELVALSGTTGGAYLLERGIFLPNELKGFLTDESPVDIGLVDSFDEAVAGCEDLLRRITVLESSVYMRNQLLRDADWAGMAHSVEVRVPYVDREVAGISGGAPHKTRLVEAFGHVLPEAMIERPKTGFETPMKAWMRNLCGETGRDHWSRDWVRFVSRAYEESLGI